MTNFSKIALCAMVIGAGTLFTSCNDSDDPAPVQLSLYDKLGGETLVADPTHPGQMIEHGRLSYRCVVDSTITLIVADIVNGANGNLGAHFAPIAGEVFGPDMNTTNVAILSDNLTDFFSFNTGGTNAVNTYSGLSMANAHNPAVNSRMGAKASPANYDKFEGYVVAAAALNGVTDPTIVGEVGTVLESLRSTIVQTQ
ncbi:MAG: hypothetical protein PSV16_00840 [Flavobacterium sp.]|nr:hypothetical protein [Flavobacterium sp.]